MRLQFAFLALAAAVLTIAPAAADQDTLSPAELGAISAGEAPQLNVATRQNLDALSGGNEIAADTVTSGNVGFSSGAFSGFNGIGNVVVNTGNNNAIQGTLSVTVVAMPR